MAISDMFVSFSSLCLILGLTFFYMYVVVVPSTSIYERPCVCVCVCVCVLCAGESPFLPPLLLSSLARSVGVVGVGVRVVVVVGHLASVDYISTASPLPPPPPRKSFFSPLLSSFSFSVSLFSYLPSLKSVRGGGGGGGSVE